MEDVIGLEPSRESNRVLNDALCELESMTGLAGVKRELASLVAVAKGNYVHELRGERTDDLALNRLFIGNPGTGKTTVAKLYGQVLKALHVLSNGQVVYKTASDFTGSVVGESQKRTRAIIELAQGKVLLIDEAYVLSGNVLYAHHTVTPWSGVSLYVNISSI
jgi:SpoVK/Ycf46/Vps4 family AAA+-type ATPase